jgi:hypothetical protein
MRHFVMIVAHFAARIAAATALGKSEFLECLAGWDKKIKLFSWEDGSEKYSDRSHESSKP